MNTSIVTTLLDETINIFRGLRRDMVKAMVNLHAIKESGEWSERFDTWGEFVESSEGLGFNQSSVSKLLSVNRAYLIDGGLDENDLVGVDYEKLYAARDLPGTPEQRLSMAKTLNRKELKETKNEAEGHVHSGDTVVIHKCCGMRVMNNEAGTPEA
jgi:hypothetical protein